MVIIYSLYPEKPRLDALVFIKAELKEKTLYAMKANFEREIISPSIAYIY